MTGGLLQVHLYTSAMHHRLSLPDGTIIVFPLQKSDIQSVH